MTGFVISLGTLVGGGIELELENALFSYFRNMLKFENSFLLPF